MDSRTTSTESTSQASTHPFHLGSLYKTYWERIWMLIRVSEVSGFKGEYDVELVCMDTGAHANATYTALEWRDWFTRIA